MSEEADRDLTVLRHKREATRYRILVEIADRQPAVSQREIAEAIGITTQAVSDYVGELVEEGYVRRGGRGRYRVTKEGVDWVLSRTDELRAFTEHVSAEVVGQVDVEAAIATGRIEAGQAVSLSMSDGALHASPLLEDSGVSGAARASAVTAAEPGDAVGVTNFEGLLDYERGSTTIVEIPSVSTGDLPRPSVLAEIVSDDRLVAVSGIEALALARSAGIEPDLRFGTPAAVQEAAARGFDVVVVAIDSDVSTHADRLREQGLDYEIVELESEDAV